MGGIEFCRRLRAVSPIQAQKRGIAGVFHPFWAAPNCLDRVDSPRLWANCGQIGCRTSPARSDCGAPTVGGVSGRGRRSTQSERLVSGARSAERGVCKERAAGTEAGPTTILSPSEHASRGPRSFVARVRSVLVRGPRPATRRRGWRRPSSRRGPKAHLPDRSLRRALRLHRVS